MPNTETGRRLGAEERWLHLLLRHIAGRRVRLAVEIEDLVQEVYLRALTAPGGLPPGEDGELTLRRFLAHIARHTVVDVARALRAKKRDRREVRLARSDWSVTGVDAGAIAGKGPGPVTRVTQSEEHERLLAAYDGLSREHRRVIGYRQFEGLTAAETAARMGSSETAVHSLYRRALRAWRGAAGGGEE